MGQRSFPSSLRSQAGFSLIEIMVGVVIGAVALLAIAQTVVVFDRHTQTTSAGGDAQMSGTLAMFNLERDIKQAGLGFGTANLQTMGCAVQGLEVATARPINFNLTPVEILHQASGAPDSINVLYGNPSFFVTTERFDTATPTTKRLIRRGGFRPGDVAVIAGNPAASAASATCQLLEITADSDPDGQTIAHAGGAYLSFYAAASAVAKFNPATGTGSVFTTGTLHNLGPAPQRNSWNVVNGWILERASLIQSTDRMEVAEGVVNLKAQYGIDADADGRITDPEWTTAAPVDWTRVLAVRVAILVRSRHFERSADPAASSPVPVTATVPTWSGAASAPFAMTDVSGGTNDSFSGSPNTADPNNWRFYRYRVYERVIPLRNTIWGH